MAKHLTLDEMLHCLLRLKHPCATAYIGVIGAHAALMAAALADAAKVNCGPTSFDATQSDSLWRVSVFATSEDQSCPEAIAAYDVEHWGPAAQAKQLNLDELLEALLTLEHPQAEQLQIVQESYGTMMAETIAARLDITCSQASFDGTAFAGTCARMTPKFPGQPCPDAIKDYDATEWDDSVYEDAAATS